MSRYRVKQEAEKITFFVNQSTLTVVPSGQTSDDVIEESITVQHPTWNQVSSLYTAASGGGMLPFAPDKELDRLLIKYFLVSASFFDIDRQTDENGQMFVANLDDLLNNIRPFLIDFAVLCIRKSM